MGTYTSDDDAALLFEGRLAELIFTVLWKSTARRKTKVLFCVLDDCRKIDEGLSLTAG